jgi:uncharacterized membrane protein
MSDVLFAKPTPVKRHFSSGLNFYMLFWAFFTGNIVGVTVEVLYGLIVNHRIESHVGLIYGPFNLVYGIGALAMTWIEYRLRKNPVVIILLAGMIVGGAVEVFCSFAQEKLFGSVSWDYANLPMNYGGRTHFKATILWGVLSVIWIKWLYPFVIKWLSKIPDSLGKTVTWLLLVFIIFDSVMSGLAVLRWSARMRDEPARTPLDTYFDTYFPDTKMAVIYYNMIFIEKDKD